MFFVRREQAQPAFGFFHVVDQEVVWHAIGVTKINDQEIKVKVINSAMKALFAGGVPFHELNKARGSRSLNCVAVHCYTINLNIRT